MTLASAIARVLAGLDTTTRPARLASSVAIAHVLPVASSATSSAGPRPSANARTPSGVVANLPGRFRNVRFRRACVIGLDPANRRVRLDDGLEVGYDHLILACEVTANFFGIPGAAEYARTTYTSAAAIEVRDRVLGNPEAYAQGREGAVEPVVVVVGGGPTGVEMAGALAELRNAGLPYAYPEVDPERVRVVLVEMTDKVLAPFAPKLREYAAEALRERGVDLRLGVAVKEVNPDCVVLADGERVPSASTIWATGVKVDDAVSAWVLPQGRGGRIRVGPDLRVEGRPEIFAVGDVAADRDAPLPQLARPAIDGGRHAGAQVRRLLAGEPTEPFAYRDRGISATIGRGDAVIQLPFGVKLRGLVAWLRLGRPWATTSMPRWPCRCCRSSPR